MDDTTTQTGTTTTGTDAPTGSVPPPPPPTANFEDSFVNDVLGALSRPDSVTALKLLLGIAPATTAPGTNPPPAPTVHQPSLSRDVHFVVNGGKSHGQHRAAKVAGVWDLETGATIQRADLVVFPSPRDDGELAVLIHEQGVFYAEALADGTYPPGTWHWPERV